MINPPYRLSPGRPRCFVADCIEAVTHEIAALDYAGTLRVLGLPRLANEFPRYVKHRLKGEPHLFCFAANGTPTMQRSTKSSTGRAGSNCWSRLNRYSDAATVRLNT